MDWPGLQRTRRNGALRKIAGIINVRCGVPLHIGRRQGPPKIAVTCDLNGQGQQSQRGQQKEQALAKTLNQSAHAKSLCEISEGFIVTVKPRLQSHQLEAWQSGRLQRS